MVETRIVPTIRRLFYDHSLAHICQLSILSTVSPDNVTSTCLLEFSDLVTVEGVLNGFQTKYAQYFSYHTC
jgi:hypothetical protein